jgi:hypothetical protein
LDFDIPEYLFSSGCLGFCLGLGFQAMLHRLAIAKDMPNEKIHGQPVPAN